MANIKDWKTTASQNNATPPDGAPEGMTAGAINDVIREVMAAVRRQFEDVYFNWGLTTVYVSGTQFRIDGVDATGVFAVGRRVRAVGSSTGTITGQVTTVSFATNTSVTVSWDSGTLQNETLSISILNTLSPHERRKIMQDVIPALSKAIFINFAAPIGWTFDNSLADRGIIFASTASGGTGLAGQWTPTFPTTTGARTLTNSEISPQLIPLASGDDFTGYRSGGGAIGHVHTLTWGSSWRWLHVKALPCTRDVYI